MTAPDRFIAWCKQEQASIEQQLELMQSGKVRTGEDIGAGWIDTLEESIERAKARLAELDPFNRGWESHRCKTVIDRLARADRFVWPFLCVWSRRVGLQGVPLN